MNNPELQVHTLKCDELVPYAGNAKVHTPEQVEQIAASIREFGNCDPIAVWHDQDGAPVIVEGHGRLMALQKLGIETAPVIYLDHLTDEQRRAYAHVHNQTTLSSGFDLDALAADMADLPAFDWEGFGLDEVPNLGEEPAEVQEVDTPETAPARVERGQVWQLGDHRLMCGDSTDAADVAVLIDGQKMGMVLTDPPYGINVVGSNGEVGANFGVAKKGKYKKIISDDGIDTAQRAYVVFSEITSKMIIWGGNYFLSFLPPSAGWIVWDKRCDSGIRNTFADGELAWCSFHTPLRIYHQLWNGMIREGEHDTRVHPTQKPIRMISEVIRDYTEAGELILDAFGGSGTTLMAAEQLGRKCYMMELDPHYCDVIIERWEQYTGGTAVLA